MPRGGKSLLSKKKSRCATSTGWQASSWYLRASEPPKESEGGVTRDDADVEASWDVRGVGIMQEQKQQRRGRDGAEGSGLR